MFDARGADAGVASPARRHARFSASPLETAGRPHVSLPTFSLHWCLRNQAEVRVTFELEADGVRVWCSSPEWTLKLVEKGARLVDPKQAVYLPRADAPSISRSRDRRRPRKPRTTSDSAS